MARHQLRRSRIVVLIATLFVATAQLLFKVGAGVAGTSVGPLPVNAAILVGFLAYGVSALLLFVALGGGELSVLYPLWSLSYVWVLLESVVVLNEPVSPQNWIGVAFIVAGVSLVGRGTPRA